MQEEVADLEPLDDADASPSDRFADDKSVDTSVDSAAETVEVETDTDEVADEPESEVDSSPTEGEVLDEKADPPESKAFQDRIDKLTESFRGQERRADELERDNQDLRKQLDEVPAQVEPFKTLAEFDYDEGKFQQYLATEVTRRATDAATKVAQDFEVKAKGESAEEAFRGREKEFAKDHKDYFDLVYGTTEGRRNWPASDAMVREIMVGDTGHEVAYYLASNPEIATEISKLSPAETIRRMALLGNELQVAKAKAKTEKKKVSKAPAPPPKIPSGKSGMEKDVADMSDREFAKWRRKEIANR